MTTRAIGGVATRNWNNHVVVPEVDRHRARRVWGVIGVMFAAAMPFAAFLLMQNECVGLTHEIDRLRSERDRLEEQQRRVDVERATLEALDPVETWAIGTHGLIRSGTERLVVVRRNAASAGRTDPAPPVP